MAKLREREGRKEERMQDDGNYVHSGQTRKQFSSLKRKIKELKEDE